LIKSGAKLVQQWQDVVTELPSEIAANILPPKLDKAETMSNQPALEPAGLNVNERKIWRALSTDETTHIDTLLDKSGLNFGDLNAAVLGLEMRELIRALPGKCYVRKI